MTALFRQATPNKCYARNSFRRLWMNDAVLCIMYLIFCLVPHQTFAQAGTLDHSFNSADLGFGYGEGPNTSVNATVVQPDNKVIIAGGFTSYHGEVVNKIARLNTDGGLDASFSSGGGPNSTITSIALQDDGRIIVIGSFSSYDGVARNRIARLNTDGSLDHTFAPVSGPDNFISSLRLQTDGRILIGGNFTSYDGMSSNRIARLNADGSFDATFNPGIGADGTVDAIAIQNDGRILIAGGFSNYNGTLRTRIARIDQDGNLDTTFDPGIGVNNLVHTISIQGDGKAIIAGTFTSNNGTARARVARINTNGSLDNTFNPGSGASSTVYAAIIQSDGKLLIGGTFTHFGGYLYSGTARLNTDGSRDVSYVTYTSGPVPLSFVLSIALQSDGRVIVAGAFDNYNGTARKCLVRVHSNGSLDGTFNPEGTGANEQVNSVKVQNNGRIILAGGFKGYNGIQKNHIARVHQDGSLDGFIGGTNAEIREVAIQPDGRILIVGSFTTCNGISRNRIARVDALGFTDASFNPGTGANSSVQALALQSDGKIIIAGSFTAYNGVGRARLARLNTNGSLDTTFDPGTGPNGSIQTAAIQSDGKVIIAGSFTSYNGVARNNIARLNIDGTLDTTFDPGTGANGMILTVVVLPDEKLLVGGWFNSFNGANRKQLARLNSDGTPDLTFNSYFGSSNFVSAIAIQNDDRIVVAGLFSTYSGASRNNIVRIHPDGTLDTSFDPGSGANSSVMCIALDNNSRAVFGGNFTGYNGTGRNRIARIWTDEDADGDGTQNVDDDCPFDPNKIVPGQCGCGNPETADSDEDGTADCVDGCPFDPDKVNPGQCGCGTADIDSDCDSVPDCYDVCPNGDDLVDNDQDGNPDCQVFPGYTYLLETWQCSNNINNEKVKVCHDGTTICVSESSLSTHLAHGDNIGPCQSCPQQLIQYQSEQALYQELEIYPNPASAELNIAFNGLTDVKELILRDLIGREIKSITIDNLNSTLVINLSDDQFRSGIYYISVLSKERWISKPIVIVK